MFWGYHLMLDCSDCDIKTITDKDIVAEFAKRLVDHIDMVAYGEPQVIHFGSGDKEGFTLVQLIETSNICAHFVNETGAIYLDVFSCKEFDIEVVKYVVQNTFYPKKIRTNYITRQA